VTLPLVSAILARSGVRLRPVRRTAIRLMIPTETNLPLVRTASGPRQEIVASLGKLPGLDDEVRTGWEEVGVDGRVLSMQMSFGESAGEVKPLWREVNIREVRVERTREFGEVYLGLALWRRLHLHTLLAELIESGKVPLVFFS